MIQENLDKLVADALDHINVRLLAASKTCERGAERAYLLLGVAGISQSKQHIYELGAEKHDEPRRLMALVKKVLSNDYELRQRFGVGNKFDFISQPLVDLVHTLETAQCVLDQPEASLMFEEAPRIPHDDECVVYIYLYHGQGKDSEKWRELLRENSLINYSMTRPIYSKLADIRRFIRMRDDTFNHAFLSVIVKKSDLIVPEDPAFAVDPLGQALVRVREGALMVGNVVNFEHAGQAYRVDDEGGVALL